MVKPKFYESQSIPAEFFAKVKEALPNVDVVITEITLSPSSPDSVEAMGLPQAVEDVLTAETLGGETGDQHS